MRALDGVSLTIPTGMFGLLGPNGTDLDALRQKDTVRGLLGYLPQDFGVYPKVSAENLLDHFARLKGIARSSSMR